MNHAIAFIRPDAIGDALLASSLLPHLKHHYRNAHITVVCQQHLTSLYQACPFVDDVVGFDKRKFVIDADYQSSILELLRSKKFDLALNSVYSRELSMEPLTTSIGARETVAFKVLARRGRWDFAFRYNRGCSTLINSPGSWRLELSRHKDFLAGLGMCVDDLKPLVWTEDDDETFAQQFFQHHELEKKTVVALFAGAQSEYRLYAHYGDALKEAFAQKNIAVIAFGAQSDDAITRANIADLPFQIINLVGQTTLRQTAALMRRCTVGFGAETGLAHMAVAVGLPHVVLLGGGHFGRFMPYSPLTSTVLLPLACYGCDWRCRYKKAYCVSDIDFHLLAQALHVICTEPVPEKPRLFIQQSAKHGHALKSYQNLLDFETIEIKSSDVDLI